MCTFCCSSWCGSACLSGVLWRQEKTIFLTHGKLFSVRERHMRRLQQEEEAGQ